MARPGKDCYKTMLAGEDVQSTKTNNRQNPFVIQFLGKEFPVEIDDN